MCRREPPGGAHWGRDLMRPARAAWMLITLATADGASVDIDTIGRHHTGRVQSGRRLAEQVGN
jgi:hypothetical protein